MSSLLDLCPDGNLLEAPREREAEVDPTAAEALREKLLASALPTQREFLEDTDHRIIGFVAGFGAGKTYSLCLKTIMLALDNVGYVGLVAEPTYPLIRDVFCRSFDEVLEQFEIEYEFRVSPQPEYRLHLPGGVCTILCRSMENWQRIRGQNLAFCLADEIDTSPAETAQKASEMMLARMRTGNVNQLAVASTPEGFKWCYRTFVEEDAEDKRLIRAKTMENPYLPEDFVPSLERNYPPNLIQAYLNGEFVNLASCAVYPDFDRQVHYTDALATERDTIFIGIDVNVGNSVTQHLIRKGDEFHFFNEAIYRDTQEMAVGLARLYPQHFKTGQLVLIPDAASKQRSTAAAQESDLGILKKYGHKVMVQQSNPLIQDRINAVNVLIGRNQVKVSNTNKHLIRTLEQLAYDDKSRPEKGGIGMDDLSHASDAMGYALYRLAAIRQWQAGKSRLQPGVYATRR
jgi:PBSX family phage terminase large subunit